MDPKYAGTLRRVLIDMIRWPGALYLQHPILFPGWLSLIWGAAAIAVVPPTKLDSVVFGFAGGGGHRVRCPI